MILRILLIIGLELWLFANAFGQIGLRTEAVPLFEKVKTKKYENQIVNSVKTILAFPKKDKSAFTPIPQIPKAWSFDHLALFCKVEIRIEKRLKTPIKFRLGTMDYVNRLEGY